MNFFSSHLRYLLVNFVGLALVLPKLLSVDYITCLSAPVTLSRQAPGVFDVRIGGDSKGNAFVIWERGDGVVQVAHYDVETRKWSQKPTFLSEAKGNSLDSHMAVAPSGKAIVVWDSSNGIHVSHYDPALKTWSLHPDILSETGFSPRVAINATGRAVVAWTVVENNHFIIQVSHYNQIAREWSLSPVTISPHDQHSDNVKVVVDQAGNVHVVWLKLRKAPGNNNVQASYYDAVSEEWRSTPIMLSRPEEDVDMDTLELVGAASGNAIAVWLDTRKDLGGICASVYNAESQKWGESTIIAKVETLPKIAIDEAGNALVIWAHNDLVEGAYYNSQSKQWSMLQMISSGQEESATVAMNADGNAVVVWQGLNNKIGVSIFDKSKEVWGSPIIMSPAESRCYDLTTFLGAEEVIVAWIKNERNCDLVQVAKIANDDPIPLPPSSLRGWQYCWNSKDGKVIDTIKWEPSKSRSVICYNVYCDPSLTTKLASIPAKGTLRFHQFCWQVQKNTYFVTAENSLGEQSRPVKITIS